MKLRKRNQIKNIYQRMEIDILGRVYRPIVPLYQIERPLWTVSLDEETVFVLQRSVEGALHSE